MSNRDDRDPPIDPQDYVAGLKVVDIGDIRVARGMSRRPSSSCRHRQLRYDNKERRVWCADCEQNVESFDAFEMLANQYFVAVEDLKRRTERVKEAEGFQARSIAAKELDAAWRCRNTVPACPHCGQGLFPEDFKSGFSTLGRDYAEAMAKRRREAKP